MAAKKKIDPEKAYRVRNKTTGQEHEVMGDHFSLDDPNYEVLGEAGSQSTSTKSKTGDS